MVASEALARARRACCALALAGGLAAAPAVAQPLTGEATGIAGMNPQLLPSRDGASVYLFAAAANTSALRFDTATKTWDASIPPLPTADIDLMKMSCYDGVCWGGPAYAVGADDTLHVVWGERGYNDCDPAAPFWTSSRLIHQRYDGSWSAPATIVERTAQSAECGYQYPAIGEDGQGNLVLIYQHAVYQGGDQYLEGSCYRTRPSGGAWSAETRITEYKNQVRAFGGFGRLFVTYGKSGKAHVTEIDPAKSSVLSDETIGNYPIASHLLLHTADETHAHYPHWTGQPDPPGVWHVDAIHYNRRTAAGWDAPASPALVDGPEIFGAPETNAEEDAVSSLSITPTGRRLLAFSYERKLYTLTHDGAGWSAPVERQTGDEVWAVSVAPVGDAQHLIVWATAMDENADVEWALIDADPCPGCTDGGPGAEGGWPDAAAPDAGAPPAASTTGGSDDGCGCRTTRPPTRWTLPFAAFALAFSARRRRRCRAARLRTAAPAPCRSPARRSHRAAAPRARA